MSEQDSKVREQALELEEGDEFKWVGEGWGDEPRPPNRATVRGIFEGTDYKGKQATVIEITGVQGGKAELYVYDDRDEVLLYGSAEKEERVLEIQYPPR